MSAEQVENGIIDEIGKDYFDYVCSVRRALHRMPELSDNEHKTSEFIVGELKKMGHKVKRVHTGCFVTVSGENKNRVVALRADIDGLPLTEEADCDFKSTNGNMHACGHDGHAAMLLTLAKMLADKKPAVNVRLIFQFGEEGAGNGAVSMIDGGALDGVDVIYAFHMCPELDEGKIATRAGGMFAGAVEYDVEFYGKESHCAAREKGTDAVLALNNYLSELREIEKKYAPHVLLHTGKISGGSARNIVSGYAKAESTFRFFDYERKEAVMMDIANALVKGDDVFSTEHRLTVNAVYGPVINGGIALGEIRKLLKVEECEPRFTAEDFSAYLQTTEGCMLWLGCKTDKYGYPLHSTRFGFDETALAYGIRAYKKLVYRNV